MNNNTNTDSKTTLTRVFKKINGVIQDYTKSKTASQPRFSKEFALKASPNPATPIQAISKEAEKIKTAKLIKRADEALSNYKKHCKDEELKENGYPNGKLYYITAGRYYVMWYNNRLWAYTMQSPNWFLVTTHKASFAILGQSNIPKDSLAGGFIPTTQDDLKNIIKNRFDLNELYLNYHLERLTEWNFKTLDELKAYLKMGDMIDYNKAEKI